MTIWQCMLLLLLSMAVTAGCIGAPDGTLPPPVRFTMEAVHTGGTPDEILVRVVPESAEPAEYSVTYTMTLGSTTLDAVAGRTYTDISATHPIELPPAPAQPGVPLTVEVMVLDRWGRTVHDATATYTPGTGGGEREITPSP
ncbi:hypothetical protein CUJ86_03305 [Methanofollis fontis]|uniref:Uncharacterized protein n=2 Tax=Methanofollis fontis TaxID=2052832 RepID=A0A483CW38_9EURY|nr:hypothetical protein CUJ86_03305 [Methanofollis fontis]